MRTVFVNPSRRRRRRNPESAYENPGKKRKRKYRYAKLRRKVYTRRRNPDMTAMVKDTAMLAAGSAAGALLNRLGISHISNFYLRNGARLVAAAVLSNMRQNPVLAVAAAGAVLAPMTPEIEMQMASTTGVKNPGEIAAELSEMLEADLSADLSDDLEDGELEDGELEDGESVF